MTVLPDDAHEPLFTATGLRLGEIHWHLLKASSLVSSRSFVERKADPGGLGLRGLTIPESTAFGEEVAGDEIQWWIFRKETDIEELRNRTEEVLASSQTLHRAARELKRHQPKTYGALVRRLAHFINEHGAEIAALLDYVRWLHARDVLAPSILFSYRVWGSTRTSERRLDVRAKSPQKERPQVLRDLTETVLGVCIGNIRDYVYNKTLRDLMFDIADGRDSDAPAVTVDDVPADSLMIRVAACIYDECSVYFTEIRDSLRNIKLDIGKFVEQRDLLHSDRFWADFISKAARSRKTETQCWDFKETLRLWHDKGPAREAATRDFAEKVAAFANADGGVLVVGVTDQRDIVGIGDARTIENRLKTARDALAHHLDYERELASFRQVIVRGHDGTDKTCLAIVVAQASGVVAVNDGHGRYSYPVRRETGLTRTSRRAIADSKLNLTMDNRDFLRSLDQFLQPG